ncbi:hypothetical protein COOONC_17172 [Cooperia oncophora]
MAIMRSKREGYVFSWRKMSLHGNRRVQCTASFQTHDSTSSEVIKWTCKANQMCCGLKACCPDADDDIGMQIYSLVKVVLGFLSIAILICCLCCLCTRATKEDDTDEHGPSTSRRQCATSNGISNGTTPYPGKTHRCATSNGATPHPPPYSSTDPVSQDPNYYLPGYPPPYPPAYPQSYPASPVQSPPHYCSLQPRPVPTESPQRPVSS